MNILTDFWEKNQDQIIPIYKGSIFVWGMMDENRKYPNFEIVHYCDDKGDIILCQPVSTDVNQLDIIWGFPIYDLVKNQPILPISAREESNYQCNECNKYFTFGSGLHCEKCNFDLCDQCDQKCQHGHKMFRVGDYFGCNTYDQEYCKDRLFIGCMENL
jgi:hypothetical protein